MKHDEAHEKTQNEALEHVIAALKSLAADLGKSALVDKSLSDAAAALSADDAG